MKRRRISQAVFSLWSFLFTSRRYSFTYNTVVMVFINLPEPLIYRSWCAPGSTQILPLREMKQYFIFSIIIAFNLEGQAQIDTSLLTRNIYAAEDSMVAISKRKDWNTYADYMHPIVIEMSGGKEGFIQILESQSEILDSVEMYKVGKIFQLSKTGRQYQCIVEAFIQMKINGEVTSGSSYDIAISENGNKW